MDKQELKSALREIVKFRVIAQEGMLTEQARNFLVAEECIKECSENNNDLTIAYMKGFNDCKQDWQPIETAPSVLNESILACDSTTGHIDTLCMESDGYHGMLHNTATHWQHLPKPPKKG